MSVRQQIYNQLPNPSEIEDLVAELNDYYSDDATEELMQKGCDALRDCLHKFHCIMQIADALPVIPHRPLQED